MGGRRVRISTVWERTLEVLQGRAGILAAIAALFILLPSLATNALAAFGGSGAATRSVAGAANLASSLLLLVGLLAITAVASDPRVDRARGIVIAVRRLGPALGCVLLLIVAAVLAILPITYLLFSSGATYTAATSRVDLTNARGGPIALAGLAALLLFVVGLYVSAKLVPLFAVIVNERRGLGAFARSFALTRGAAWRLVGVIILYGVVLLVLGIATTSVVGVVARLLLGGEALPAVAFVVSTFGAILTALASTVQAAFYAQYYVAAAEAVAEAGAGEGPEAERAATPF
ncbi:hypothetical protein [Sphingomonas corticis]|uniref:Glycerophosphoryl diester phosphodiesterase membrane domain-containing protein n=1 Tax=Sphingomonas corticis TaxID=2722791 RepID=A0ABX1CQN8_9SPHN|nr:hypothetical protein [Sphingomonas corticis]NJR80256.1 hypothetical protein [Sphingomonas corticis]